MANRDCKAFIVEGEAREPQIIENIERVFFAHANFRIITLPAGKNIYMLWNRLKEDEFHTDIIEVLRESSEEIRKQLDGMARDDFSEVYLFFDYDTQQTNLSHTEEGDVVARMLQSFDNETENGKLYISYPMVEALRDVRPGVCGDRATCFVAPAELKEYKRASAARAVYPHLKTYDDETWKEIIDVFAMRVSCLCGSGDTLEYGGYSGRITPAEVYTLEDRTEEKGVFVLSAFPEFLVDYFGRKLWRSCVRHRKNQRQAHCGGSVCAKGNSGEDLSGC